MDSFVAIGGVTETPDEIAEWPLDGTCGVGRTCVKTGRSLISFVTANVRWSEADCSSEGSLTLRKPSPGRHLVANLTGKVQSDY